MEPNPKRLDDGQTLVIIAITQIVVMGMLMLI